MVVTEIFDSELLGEGVLPTLRHAAANLLEARASGCVGRCRRRGGRRGAAALTPRAAAALHQ